MVLPNTITLSSLSVVRTPTKMTKKSQQFAHAYYVFPLWNYGLQKRTTWFPGAFLFSPHRKKMDLEKEVLRETYYFRVPWRLNHILVGISKLAFSPYLNTPNITSETMSLFKETWKTTRPTIKERNMFMFNNDLFSNVTFFCLRGGLQNLLLQRHSMPVNLSLNQNERKIYSVLFSCWLIFKGSIFKISPHHHPRAQGHAN